MVLWFQSDLYLGCYHLIEFFQTPGRENILSIVEIFPGSSHRLLG